MTTFDQKGQNVQTQYNAERITIYQRIENAIGNFRSPDANRARFLVRLHARYSAILAQSLQGAMLFTLGLHTRLEAVNSPTRLVFRHLDAEERALSPDTSITQVYDEAGGEILLLGEPGSGKSTLLLTLALSLIERAQADDLQHLPVIFNLASWAEKHQALEEWLVEELFISYQVPRKLGKRWLEDGLILPLLDGLDEVVDTARSACIEAINTYRRAHLTPLVVASRTTEYFLQQKLLELQGAIVLQPLSMEQIDDYLVLAGEQVATLRAVMQQHGPLRELAQSPLMLNVLMLTYRNAPEDSLPSAGTAEELQQRILAAYVDRMLQASQAKKDILAWLSWLACGMRQHNQVVFYIETLQASWLSGERLRQTYTWLAMRFVACFLGILVSFAVSAFFISNGPGTLVFIVCLGIFMGLSFIRGAALEENHRVPAFTRWPGALIAGVGFAVLFGSLYSLVEALIAGLIGVVYGAVLQRALEPTRTTGKTMLTGQGSKAPIRQFLVKQVWLRNGLLVGLATDLSFGLCYGVFGLFLTGTPTGQASNGFYAGLLFGLLYGSFFGLIFGITGGILSRLLVGRNWEIQPADLVAWSWRSVRNHLGSKRQMGIVAGIVAVFALIGAYSYIAPGWLETSFYGYPGLAGNRPTSLLSFLLMGLLFGLFYWLVSGFYQGLSRETIDNDKRTRPNQGIRRSLVNGLLYGFIGLLVIGVVHLALAWIQMQGNHTISFLSYFQSNWEGIVSVALIAALFNGWLVSIQHYVLSFLLTRKDGMPQKLSSFLDDAARHILLYRVGGGYAFTHKVFLDYFVSLAPGTTAEPPTGTMPTPQHTPVVPRRAQTKRPGQRLGIMLAFVVYLVLLITLMTPRIQSETKAYQISVTNTRTAHFLQQTATIQKKYPYPNYLSEQGELTGKLVQYNLLAMSGMWSVPFPDANAGGTCYMKPDGEHVIEDKTHHAYGCAIDDLPENFALQVQMSILQGDCGGVGFRGGSENGYEFLVCSDGLYALRKYEGTGNEATVKVIFSQHDSTGAIHQGIGKSNIVTLQVQGNMFRLYVNKKPLVKIQGENSSLKSAGLVVLAGAMPTQVTYTEMMVWQLVSIQDRQR